MSLLSTKSLRLSTIIRCPLISQLEAKLEQYLNKPSPVAVLLFSFSAILGLFKEMYKNLEYLKSSSTRQLKRVDKPLSPSR
nr:MAG TPA: hypothetical protein [Caudoviricetes sp.]